MRRIVRYVRGFAIGVAGLLLAGVGQANGGVFLTWDAPARCPRANALRVGVEQTLGRAWLPLETDLDIDVRITEAAKRWSLELQVRRGKDEPRVRSLQGESCQALVEAAAAIVALTLESEPVSPVEQLPSPSTASQTPSVALPSSEDAFATTDRPTLPAERSLRRRSPAPFVEADLLVDAWALPKPALGARIGEGLSGKSWGASIGLLGLLPATTEADEDKTARLWLVAGQVRACHRARFGVVGLVSCGAFEGGWIWGSTHGLPQDGSGGDTWLALGPELGFEVAFASAHRLRFGGAAPFPLVRQQFVVGDSGRSVHEIPWVTLRAQIGYGLDFR